MLMYDDPSGSRPQAKGPASQLKLPPPISPELDQGLRQLKAARSQGTEPPSGLHPAAAPVAEPSQPTPEVTMMTDMEPSSSPSQAAPEVTLTEPSAATVEVKPSSPTAAELEAEEQAFRKAFASLPAKRVMSDDKKVHLPLKELQELLQANSHLEMLRFEVSDPALMLCSGSGELALDRKSVV